MGSSAAIISSWESGHKGWIGSPVREEEAEAPKESEEVQALKAKLEQAWAVKEKFKSTAIKVQKE